MSAGISGIEGALQQQLTDLSTTGEARSDPAFGALLTRFLSSHSWHSAWETPEPSGNGADFATHAATTTMGRPAQGQPSGPRFVTRPLPVSPPPRPVAMEALPGASLSPSAPAAGTPMPEGPAAAAGRSSTLQAEGGGPGTPLSGDGKLLPPGGQPMPPSSAGESAPPQFKSDAARPGQAPSVGQAAAGPVVQVPPRLSVPHGADPAIPVEGAVPAVPQASAVTLFRDQGSPGSHASVPTVADAREPGVEVRHGDRNPGPTLSTVAGQAVSAGTVSDSPSEGLRQWRMPEPMSSPQWQEGLGERLLQLHGRGGNRAEIHVDPPELGPIRAEISLKGEEVSVLLSARQAAARDLMEQCLPRLREMFGEAGLHLGEVRVGDDAAFGQHQRHGAEDDRGQGGMSAGSGDVSVESDAPVSHTRPKRGLIDDYV